MLLPFKLTWRIILFIVILLLLAMASISELLPFVKEARNAVPPEVYEGTGICGCSCISESRPWYSTFNHWFWLWVLTTPFIISFITPNTAKWKKITLTLLAIGVCYPLMVIAFHLSWDIRNNIFLGLDFSLTNDMQCSNTNDSSRAFISIFAWVYASFYVAFCFLVKWFITRWFSLKINHWND